MLKVASRGVLSRSALKLQNTCNETEVARQIRTGGGGKHGEESGLSMEHIGEKTTRANSLLNEELQAIIFNASRQVAQQEDSVLSASAVGAVAKLQSSLMHQTFSRYQCLRIATIFRKILSNNIVVDGTVYVTLLRAVCARGGIDLDMNKSQVATALEEILMAAHQTFKNSPIPLIESVLPTYIRACVGLNIPYSLRIAGEAIAELRVDNDFREDSIPVVHESLENISLNLFKLTEMWRVRTFKKKNLVIITKKGTTPIQKLTVSKYHYMVMQNLQSLFHELESATNRFCSAHDENATMFPAKKSKSKKSRKSLIDSDSGQSWISSVRDVCGKEVWRRCLVNGPYNRKLFMRNVRIPELDKM